MSTAAKKNKSAESPKAGEQKPEIEKARKEVSKGKSETVEKPSPVESVKAGKQEPEIEKDRKPKTNNKNLQSTRQAIVDEVGEETVARAEAAVKSILNSDDTGVFVRVGGNDTLARILGDRFKNSVELGSDADVPGLTESYQVARKRVEKDLMGYEEDYDPTDRPIYAYFGSSNLKSSSHADVAAFGEVTLKLKSDVKQRATFTGADSFKSGVASEVGNPNAASMVQSTKHGKEIGLQNAKDTLDSLGKAKNIDEMLGAIPTDGNRYVEAQIHGQVKPEDIGEIHYNSSGEPPSPSKAVREWAQKNGVSIYQNGKLYDPIEVSPKRREEIAKTITKEDFDDYIAAKARVNLQEDTGATHQKTYDEWRSSREDEIRRDPRWMGKNSKFDQQRMAREIKSETAAHHYHRALRSSVDAGLHIPDRVAASLGSGLKKAEKTELLKKSDSNKTKAVANSKLHREIDAILEEPIVSEEVRKNYKPRMTMDEAKAYTRDSMLKDFDFYHGSANPGAIDAIANGGVKISANNNAMIGGGFYMSSSQDVAKHYAFTSDGVGSYVTTKVNMKNPVVYDTLDEYMADVQKEFGSERGNPQEFEDALGKRFGPPGTGYWSAMMKLKGHDGVYLKDASYLVAFEKEQVVTYGVTKVADTKADERIGDTKWLQSQDAVKKVNDKLKVNKL